MASFRLTLMVGILRARDFSFPAAKGILVEGVMNICSL